MSFIGNITSKIKQRKKSGLNCPKVRDSDVQRAIEKIYEDLNKLKDGTNKSIGTDSEDYDGNPGDIRIVKTSKKLTGGGPIYNLEVKGEDGWVTGKIGGTPVPYFSVGSRKKFEKTEVIINEETGEEETAPEAPPLTAGDVTDIIQDLLPDLSGYLTSLEGALDPDYESEWLLADRNTTVEIPHGLNLTEEPKLVQLYASEVNNPVIGTNPIVTDFHLNGSHGYRMHFVDANTINIYTGSSGLYHEGPSVFGGSDGDVPLETFHDGYIKLKMWK